MKEDTTDIRQLRISEVLETQPDFFTPAVQVRRRTQGRALGRLVTLLMLLILVVVIAAQTVVASPVDQIGAGSVLFRLDNEMLALIGVLALPLAALTAMKRRPS